MEQRIAGEVPNTIVLWLKNVIYWAFFSVGSALIVIGIRYVLLLLAQRQLDCWGALAQSMEKGELLGITIALLGEDMGFLIKNKEVSPKNLLFRVKPLLMGLNLAIIVGAAAFLTLLTTKHLDHQDLSANLVMYVSLGLFCGAVVGGIVIKGMEK